MIDPSQADCFCWTQRMASSAAIDIALARALGGREQLNKLVADL
jgi:hypothetical protein